MEGRELGHEDVGLGVENVFGPVVQVEIPYLENPVRFVRGGNVLGVC